MAYIDRLSHKESLFRTIFSFCNIERHEDGLYLKPLNPKMKDIFAELGFTTPVNCKAFCQAWEENTRAIWEHWHIGDTYSGCTALEYYDSFTIMYFRESLEKYDG